MSDGDRAIGSFRVNVYDRSSPDPLNSYAGTADEWQLKPVISVAIGDQSYSVRVSTVWADLLQGTSNRIEQNVDGLCTIVKFGNLMQLRESCRVVIEINL